MPSLRRSIHLSRSIRVVVCCCSVLASRASAQSLGPFDALGPPVGQRMLCHPIPVTPADSAAVLLRFLDGRDELEPRETMIAYDSAGAPLYITVFAGEVTSSGQKRIHAIAARLGAGAFGDRSTLGDTTGGGEMGLVERRNSALGPVPGSTPLTESEIARARFLAARLWDLSCRNGPPRED